MTDVESICAEMSDSYIAEQIKYVLRSHGIYFEQAWMFDRADYGIDNGLRAVVRYTEITFKVLDAQTILIVLFKIEKKNRMSLCHPIKDFVWFLRLLGRSVPSLQSAIGLVNVFPYRNCDGISSSRLAQLYQRFGAETYDVDGRTWVRYSIK